MSNKMHDRISFFRSQLQNRRFGEETLGILESILVSKDVNSLLEIRSILKEFLRSEAVLVFQDILEKPVEEKLFILDFFVRAFALSGDVESCLALKYEALVIRDQKCVNQEDYQVTYEEWLTFAEDSLKNGFYSIAVKGFENALLRVQPNNVTLRGEDFFSHAQVAEKIKKLKDVAVASVASHSVRAQSAEHMKRKIIQKNDQIIPRDTQLASSLFRNGIKKRNMQKLRVLQSLHQINTES
ncbi:hypothetical protein C5167_002283 [Papaver somniferum]|uniref:Uncharacterized protein n=1 Tax=Papaver somniferum TaxID=3469 RepID=A0A4Y7L107_PAPSO|nr:uncharacterized protein LOC113312449 [Papaver somniferum]RZC78118.1 hypothetical protein C5167_002283 [Papaver somniferum]